MICKKKLLSVWSVLLGATFLCCSAILLKAFLYYGTYSLTTISSSSESVTANLLKENCKQVCSTSECLDIANNILVNMDPRVNPCEDFNAFACGNYEQKLGRETSASIMDSRNEDILLITKDILETGAETKHDESAAQKMKLVYDSCMNSKTSELQGFQEMLNFVSKIGISNWPHLSDNFTFENTSFLEILVNLSLYEESVFIRFLREDLFRVLPQYETYKSDSELKEVKNTVEMILQYANTDMKKMASIWEDFMQVDNGIQELFKNNSNSQPACDGDKSSDIFVNCSGENAELGNMFCDILMLMLQQDDIVYNVSGKKLYFICKDMHYMENLPPLLHTFSDRAVANYIALRIFFHNLESINFRIKKNSKYFLKRGDHESRLLLRKDAVDTWKFCVSWIAENMAIPLLNIYTVEMLPEEVVDEITEFVINYAKAGNELVQIQNWIRNETKASAAKKILGVEFDSLKLFEIARNRAKIDHVFRKFQPISTTFILNVLNFKKFHFKNSEHNEIDLSSSLFKYFTSEAYGGEKYLEIMLGMFLPPLYKYGYPKLFNTAKIGLIIGHESGHNFYFSVRDVSFRDEYVDNTTFGQFKERVRCFQDQYSGFELELTKRKLNGNYSIMENLPDNYGLRVTEKLSEPLIQKMNKEIFALPGLLGYPLEEIFYIATAQTWCGVISIESEQEEFFHSPPKFRIIGPLQNSVRFSQVFNCPLGSAMNPTKKCFIIE